MGERYKGKDITPDSGTDPRQNSRVKIVSHEVLQLLIGEGNFHLVFGTNTRKKDSSVKIEDPFTFQLLQRIFPDQCLSSEAGAVGTEKALTLQNLPSVLDRALVGVMPQKIVKHEKTPERIGPAEVVFDISANVGTLIVEPNRLGVKSHSNFSTMRANCCVYQGKWLYELMLGSKGVMQLGWCTIKCKFSQEEGVGDTPDSYAYDGSRVRKWNVKTQRYGEPWLTGDVITCTIDCDNGIMTFYRNGKCLGEAFNNVKIGKGYAYFPAVSLSPSENVCANFGATPLQYPVEGFRPLQESPDPQVSQAQVLFSYLDILIPVMVEEEMKDDSALVAGKGDNPRHPLMEHRSKKCSLLLVAAHIFDKLAPLLKAAYVVEACLLKFLLKHNDTSDFLQPVPKISKVLDLMWSLMQDFELKPCLEHLMVSMLSSYRFSPVTPDFRNPRTYLTLLVAILRHQRTRRYLLENVLFDKIKFPIFLHIKPPDDAGLADMVPTVWWEGHKKEGDDSLPNESAEERERKTKYEAACRSLQEKIEDIEAIQIEILKLLLHHKDIVDGKTTRVVFIEKFRHFLKDNSGMARIHEINTCPLPVGLCFFHRMVKVLRYYWDDFRKENPVRFVNSSEAFMPIQEFWSDIRDYFEFQRCGGSISHLNKMLGAEVNRAQGIDIKDGEVIYVQRTDAEILEYPETEMPSGNSLMELLDGVALLYHIASHKQLGKMSTLRDNLMEYVLSLEDTEKKLRICAAELSEVKMELERARAVFLEKITEQARQMSWVIAVIYSKSKQEDVTWLLGVAMRTVEKATRYKQLFQYMPEFYIEIVINAYNALKNYFHPTSSMEQIPSIDELNRKYAMFLITNFANNRIVISDARDNIIQAFACFTCYEKSLKVLETLPVENQKAMMLSLIAPYENRSWAQTNWILVRIWKGSGFGFRYSHLPHLVPSKVQLTEFGTASLQPPCPSKVFQNFMKDILHTESEVATRFLDTLLSQLNWSFSEFIGMMQEIQQVLSRTEPRLLETRQLKICSTCFEISVCLFRVLEMVVNIAPDLFLDPAKPSSDLLLSRLVQLVCQVLNRITMKGGMFDSVVSLYITGMESVTYYPILSVLAGILIHLILKTDPASQNQATVALLSDPSFQLKTLEFMLGAKVPSEKPIDNIDSLKDRVFDFRHYKEVNEEEISALQQLISHIQQQQETFVRKEQVVKDEDICTICYANPKSAMFQPCGHQSCRTCISQQMMSKKECFFCKAVIVAVLNLQGQLILPDKHAKHSTT